MNKLINKGSLGSRVQFLMNRKNVSSEQLCKEAGIDKSTLRDLLSNLRTPHFATIKKIANYLGKSPGWIRDGVQFIEDLKRTDIYIDFIFNSRSSDLLKEADLTTLETNVLHFIFGQSQKSIAQTAKAFRLDESQIHETMESAIEKCKVVYDHYHKDLEEGVSREISPEELARKFGIDLEPEVDESEESEIIDLTTLGQRVEFLRKDIHHVSKTDLTNASGVSSGTLWKIYFKEGHNVYDATINSLAEALSVDAKWLKDPLKRNEYGTLHFPLSLRTYSQVTDCTFKIEDQEFAFEDLVEEATREEDCRRHSESTQSKEEETISTEVELDTLAKRITYAREANGFTKAELRRISTVGQGTLWKIENKGFEDLRPDTYKKLSKALGVSVQWLKGETSELPHRFMSKELDDESIHHSDEWEVIGGEAENLKEFAEQRSEDFIKPIREFQEQVKENHSWFDRFQKGLHDVLDEALDDAETEKYDDVEEEEEGEEDPIGEYHAEIILHVIGLIDYIDDSIEALQMKKSIDIKYIKKCYQLLKYKKKLIKLID